MKIHCRYDEMVPIAELRPHPKNRNKHGEDQIERLSKLLQAHGVRAPIVVSRLSGFIVKGHGTVLAISRGKINEAPVVYQDFESEEEEYQFLQADNAIASWAELDLKGIHLDLPDLAPFDIDLLGIRDFQFEPDPEETKGDEDEVPETPNEPKSRLGDLFLLGNHRLLCGDSTDVQAVSKLMNGEKADMVFTDPPYGVAVENTMGKIAGDEDLEVFKRCLPVIKETAVASAHFYIWCASGDRLPESIWEFSRVIPFQNLLPVRVTHENKRGPKGGFKLNYETCLFGNDNTRGFGTSKKFPVSTTTLGDARYEGDGYLKVYPALWDGERATEHNMNIVHPTQKKVEMIEFYVEISSAANAVVFDAFLGSGSTLIACEKTNRKCYGMEIDPHYCDVILERWSKYTGKDPVREDGVKWSELKAGSLENNQSSTN